MSIGSNSLEKLGSVQALKETAVLWNWLADNPGKDKYSAAEVLDMPQILEYKGFCPLCEWVHQHHPMRNSFCVDCDSCLLFADNHCGEPTNPYNMWDVSDFNDPSAARTIADLAAEAADFLTLIGYKE